MNEKKIGAYEDLLDSIGFSLDDPFSEREKALHNLADKLHILNSEGWLERFLGMSDLFEALESSCWYDGERESWEERGYEYGRESAYEDIEFEKDEKFQEWLDKFTTFLKNGWMNLNKEQIRELDDWLNAYPFSK
jgi:hypothetical protein